MQAVVATTTRVARSKRAAAMAVWQAEMYCSTVVSVAVG